MIESRRGPRYKRRSDQRSTPYRGPACPILSPTPACSRSGEHTAARLARLLAHDQRQRRTRKGRRALNPWRHAVLVLRWFLDATRVAQLAVDNGIGRSTAYRYLHEGIDALTAAAPSLHGALLAAKAAGHTHVALDGTLVRTDRSKPSDPPQPATDARWTCGGRASTITTAGTCRS